MGLGDGADDDRAEPDPGVRTWLVEHPLPAVAAVAALTLGVRRVAPRGV